MDQPATFARHFARLVWLLVHEPANVDEQKASLRALPVVIREGAVTLNAHDGQLSAGAAVVPPAFSGVADTVGRMAAHGLRGIDVDAAAGPAELLGVARILAGPHTPRDGGATAEEKRASIGATHVRFTPMPVPGALPDLELLETLDEATPATPRRPRLSSADAARPSDAGTEGLFGQFASLSRTSAGSRDALLGELAQTVSADRLDHVLNELANIAELGARNGDPQLGCDILIGIVRREATASDTELKRLLATALRRMAKPAVLSALAMGLPRQPERRAEIMAVLARTGEDGADALAEQVGAAAQQSDRRAYFDALLELRAGIPTLIHMLGDARWFVVRNAADLLGEMQARDAEEPLVSLLNHDDDRVRRSATGALMKLGTTRALQAIQDVLREGIPQMRMQAAAALVARGDLRASTLLRALDTEADGDVQAAFLLALGKMATPDAVQRLIEVIEKERGFFQKKTTTIRLAAVQGLAEAGTPRALEALRSLLADKEADIREAAGFSLSRLARQGTATDQ